MHFLLGLGLVRALPTAIDPAALEQERELAVAFLLAHGRPGLGRRKDLLRREAAAVRALVIVERLADRGALSDPLSAGLDDDVSAVRRHQRHERVVRRAGGGADAR